MPLEEYPGLPAGNRQHADLPLVIDDVNIVDAANGTIRPGQSIIITGARITYAGPGSLAPALASATRVAGKGRFAIPGLWDMHVHTIDLSAQLHLPLLLANGVTTVRDMGNGCSFGGELDCDTHNAGARTGPAPRLLASVSHHVEGKSEGLVQALRARGQTLLKLQLEGEAPAADFYALVNEAKAHGMKAVGHLPYTVDLLDPRLGPLHSIEHDDGLLPQCARLDTPFDGRNRSKPQVLKRYDAGRCDAVLALMAQRGIAYVPTHVASSGQDRLLLTDGYQRDARLAYVPLPQRLMWRGYAGMTAAGVDDDERAPLEAWHKAALALTARAHARGVMVMAGSDSIDAYVTHGFGLHDELAHLVNAGLTPAQALDAATAVPARHSGLGKEYGSIDAGKVADIVLLQRNPLDDIANSRSIDAVILNGQLYDNKEVRAMRAFVARQASSFSVNCKFVWNMIKPW